MFQHQFHLHLGYFPGNPLFAVLPVWYLEGMLCACARQELVELVPCKQRGLGVEGISPTPFRESMGVVSWVTDPLEVEGDTQSSATCGAGPLLWQSSVWRLQNVALSRSFDIYVKVKFLVEHGTRYHHDLRTHIQRQLNLKLKKQGFKFVFTVHKQASEVKALQERKF